LKRFHLPEIFGMLLGLLLIGVFFFGQYGSQKTLLAEQHTMALDVAYHATIDLYRLDVETRFRLQVMRPEVMDLMAQALVADEHELPVIRGRLFRLMKPVHDELKQLGLRQFLFHLADDRVLLRFHRPQAAGDALFQQRSSVRIANQEKRPAFGLEIGRTQPGFRYVFPVLRDGQHLGSVEFAMPFDVIQDRLLGLLKQGEFGLLFKLEAVLASVDANSREKFVESSIHPDFAQENPQFSRVTRDFVQSEVVSALEPELRNNPDVQRRMRAGDSLVVPLTHAGQDYLVSFLPVRGLDNRLVAYVIRFAKTDALQLVRDNLLRQALLAGFLCLVVAALFFKLRRKQIELAADIHRRQAAEAGLELYANIFRHSGEAILVTDSENKIIEINPAFVELTGYSAPEVVGSNPGLLASGKTPAETYAAMWAALNTTGHWQGELWDRRKSGCVYPKWASISAIRDASGAVINYIASFSDISERKAAEARIERLAHHDALTGLLNRYSLESRLEQVLLSARRDQQHLAVLFIDMDRFKNINDTLGHAIGDLLLIEVARRLEGCVRACDIVARLGGDEFVVVLTALESAHEAMPVANKILRRLTRTYQIGGHSLHSSPSIGVAICPADGDSVADLLKKADAAMYSAKEKGRKNIRFFTAELTAVASERMALENELRGALAGGQLELYYQPQVAVQGLRIRGVEALLRWHHPLRGMVPPDRFIPIAEESGQIEEIGAWVIDTACRQLAEWQEQGIHGVRMAINLSAQQLRSPVLVDLVSKSIRKHGIAAADLELEITESVAMEDPEAAIGQMQRLRGLGLSLAIDDFGTGYSSLAYLKNLPIQILKLDRSFVRDIEVDANDAAISAATVALAHRLGLEVIAEGVETVAQAEYLGIDHGCDILQGYLFGRPVPASELTETLRQPPDQWSPGQHRESLDSNAALALSGLSG
jgi:diguanylate cyclase (GGDEF)-like protein/PAS domain S-box-containing protein